MVHFVRRCKEKKNSVVGRVVASEAVRVSAEVCVVWCVRAVMCACSSVCVCACIHWCVAVGVSSRRSVCVCVE